MRDVVGWEGLYAVTEDGKVWSYPRSWVMPNGGTQSHNGFFLKQLRSTNGYWLVFLSQPGRRVKMKQVHRLVATAFIPNPDDKPEVNHIDSDRGNNNFSNLEWVTRSENNNHMIASGRHRVGRQPGQINPHSKLTNDQVLAMRRLREQGLGPSQIARMYGVKPHTVTQIVQRKRWTHI